MQHTYNILSSSYVVYFSPDLFRTEHKLHTAIQNFIIIPNHAPVLFIILQLTTFSHYSFTMNGIFFLSPPMIKEGLLHGRTRQGAERQEHQQLAALLFACFGCPVVITFWLYFFTWRNIL